MYREREEGGGTGRRKSAYKCTHVYRSVGTIIDLFQPISKADQFSISLFRTLASFIHPVLVGDRRRPRGLWPGAVAAAVGGGGGGVLVDLLSAHRPPSTSSRQCSVRSIRAAAGAT